MPSLSTGDTLLRIALRAAGPCESLGLLYDPEGTLHG